MAVDARLQQDPVQLLNGNTRGAAASVSYGRVVNETDAILHHYETIREERRITEGIGELELIRTREIAQRFLPPAPGSVLDVGGGTGVHARWLADAGYRVHVVDLTPRHVEFVHNELGAPLVTAEVGDARELRHGDDSFDAALLLGPLYHLTERASRVQALAECARVVRAGGVVLAAAISRFASLFDGLARGYLFDDRFEAIAMRDLFDGQHRNPSNDPHWFTTAYFHRPDDLEGEAVDAGLTVLGLFGIEGMAGWLPDLDTPWATSRGRDTILAAARATETEASLRGLSPHMILACSVAE